MSITLYHPHFGWLVAANGNETASHQCYYRRPAWRPGGGLRLMSALRIWHRLSAWRGV
jgi:hypothetical protein